MPCNVAGIAKNEATTIKGSASISAQRITCQPQAIRIALGSVTVEHLRLALLKVKEVVEREQCR
ncbi:hypothetical protein M8013_05885 [Enterobacteriaceae bacterium H4N4]|uniref:Uncharacterized protein n=1 Tax=Silvania confinis TaxID=2926470 RepID=A0A9J6QFW6_9ENTR|nr:hypothetical protein [Silvania confinis]MCU6668286.1 hypothetical protein [Silvania confinis]